jgi:hypothetical protein
MSSGFGGLNQGLNNSNSNTAALESINELKSLVTSVRVVDIVLDYTDMVLR